MRFLLALIPFLVLAILPAFAQTETTEELQDKIEELREKITELENTNAELLSNNTSLTRAHNGTIHELRFLQSSIG